MAIFYKLLRFLCLCIVMQKGSWTPQQGFNKKQNVTVSKKRKGESVKPEWLKQWTISKGWMHNRSHLLHLGLENDVKEETVVEIETPKPSRRIWGDESSSVSLEHIDDLISLANSDVGTSKTRNNDLFTNYRRNFPDHHGRCSDDDLQLPEIYKERLLLAKQENANFLTELWEQVKPKRKSKGNRNCKFTVNQLYDCKEINFQNTDLARKPLRNTLSQNIALYNTLNSKTNLLEDTIYECSEDSNSLYHNPIYSSTQQENRTIAKYYDFHTNHLNKPDSFVRRRYRLANQPNHKFNSMKYRLKTEKYIIRHIKVRIMLSLKIGRFQKLCNKRQFAVGNHDRQALLFKSGAECCENFTDEQSSLRRRIVQAHEEQRRIGNGRCSLKIQNMRYFRSFTKIVH